MALPPLVIKLRCTTWAQVATIYERDLKRSALFLRTPTPVPLGREIRVDMVMPSGTVVTIEGRVAHHIPNSDRGAGVDIVLTKLPPSALWLIESALARAAVGPGADENVDEDREAAAAEHELTVALEAELRGFRDMNGFQILGIGYDGGEPEARAAFGALSKKYHPDRFARYQSERLRVLAAEIFVVLREAYRQVADNQGRALVRPGSRSGTPVRGVPLPPSARAGTPVQGVPIPPSARAGTPVQGVPIHPSAARAGTPIQGVPITPSPARAGTPIQGVPITPSPAPRAGTPVQGVPITPARGAPPPRGPAPARGNAGDVSDGVPQPMAYAETSPVLPIPSGNAPPLSPARQSPGPASPSSPRPVVTFNRPDTVKTPPAAAVPDGASGLSHEDLFGDMGDMAAQSAPPPLALSSPGVAQADSLLAAGRHDEAIAEYEKALRASPTDRAARSGRELAFGLKLLAAGDRTGAAERFEAALEIEPWSERAARELASLRRVATERGKGLLAKLLGKGGS